MLGKEIDRGLVRGRGVKGTRERSSKDSTRTTLRLRKETEFPFLLLSYSKKLGSGDTWGLHKEREFSCGEPVRLCLSKSSSLLEMG